MQKSCPCYNRTCVHTLDSHVPAAVPSDRCLATLLLVCQQQQQQQGGVASSVTDGWSPLVLAELSKKPPAELCNLPSSVALGLLWHTLTQQQQQQRLGTTPDTALAVALAAASSHVWQLPAIEAQRLLRSLAALGLQHQDTQHFHLDATAKSGALEEMLGALCARLLQVGPGVLV